MLPSLSLRLPLPRHRRRNRRLRKTWLYHSRLRAPRRHRGSSSSQTSAQQPAPEQSQHEKAEQQIKEQEKQRLVGVVPQFNISYRSDAVLMTAGQKMKLALRSTTDPVAFGVAFVVAGYHEAMDDNKGFGWGIEGYGKRSGAAYLDAFDGNMIGNGILPAILHQDPRYFRLGHGTFTHRLLYSLATNVICKHDNTGSGSPTTPMSAATSHRAQSPTSTIPPTTPASRIPSPTGSS